MKINSIGIQSYQHVPKRDEGTIAPQTREQDAASVTIEPKDSLTTSALAINAKTGNYGKTLTTEERRALELVFSRFKDAGRFSANGRIESEKAEIGLGQIIDVKV
jgi:hypothetical protein